MLTRSWSVLQEIIEASACYPRYHHRRAGRCPGVAGMAGADAMIAAIVVAWILLVVWLMLVLCGRI